GSDSLGGAPAIAHASSLGELFRTSAGLHAARNALWVDGSFISYSGLMELAAAIAHALANFGLGDGASRCAVLGNRGLVDFPATLGASLGRAIYVPLNVRHPPQRLAQIVHEASAGAVVVDARHLDHARLLLGEIAYPVLVLLPDCVNAPDWA